MCNDFDKSITRFFFVKNKMRISSARKKLRNNDENECLLDDW
jgi:hypothetical protein